ncbi:MAG: isoprenylcysteine carboxylmethyltransferase family protein [Xanthomonadales bacterium]|nr:isoprenylcysteine carboxylmethyltransferase family protein [Xanthomonadales bacterium]
MVLMAWATHATPGFLSAGCLLVAMGIVVRIVAAGCIRKNHELAMSGPYASVRHPLYLGNLLVLAGFALGTQSLLWPVLVVLFAWLYYPPAIRYEDAKLERMFGEDWRSWSQRTPALLPRSVQFSTGAGCSWGLQQAMLENGELLIAAFIGANEVIAWI